MHAVIRMDEGNKNWSRFYVDIPFFFETTLTAGRFLWELEDEYYIGGATSLPTTGGFAAYDSILTDRHSEAVGHGQALCLRGASQRGVLRSQG